MSTAARNSRRPCPKGRRSSSTRRAGHGRTVIDIDNYVPYFLTVVNTTLSRGASARYLREFGVGVTEWRVLSWLATEPGIAASRICEVIALDKSAVSRSVARLERMGLIDSLCSPRDPRRKRLELNERGYELHDRIMEIALEREAALIEEVDPEDLEIFLRVMRVLRRNVGRL